ncbi:helix-turn-helix domain-containing protein [Paenisporosarcina sp. TG20]|uniref:helix-turn-helix domain-containing protein n=1 Tax=Paenisporosarcina sp. TG20 TaxID=1211706 RepID=UPI0002D5C83A|nr:helix-turn-helix transcriptional regulator [Paenisporosarcina sp. TG20]
MQLHELIVEYRRLSQLKQKEAAKLLNISASTLSRYETNPESISLPVFRAMSKLYQIPRDISNEVIYNSSTVSRKRVLRVQEPVDNYGEKFIDEVYHAYKSDPVFYRLFQEFYSKPSQDKEKFKEFLFAFFNIKS